MCAQHGTASPAPNHRMYIYYLAAIILGVGAGLSDNASLLAVGQVISDLFVRIFKYISLPIIALSIIVTLSQYAAGREMQNIWKRSLFYTLSTTILAALVALVFYLLISPANISGGGAEVGQATSHALEQGYFRFLLDIVPANIFAPFIEHQVLAALFSSLLVGIAIRYIPDDTAREAVQHFFRGFHGIFLVLTGWVVRIIPIALFGFISVTVSQFQHGVNIGGLGEYLAVIVLANIVQGFVILPLLLLRHGISPFKAMHAMLPALSVAFFSKSSAGTLPVTMETAEKRLGVSPKVARFVLPLCTSINMNGCAAFIFVTVIYLMQNNGADISLPTMLVWVLIATIAAIGNAGVPMGCFFLSASLLTSMGVPIELLGLILPFYSLIDMLETSLNVWSDSCVAKVVDERNKAEIPAE